MEHIDVVHRLRLVHLYILLRHLLNHQSIGAAFGVVGQKDALHERDVVPALHFLEQRQVRHHHRRRAGNARLVVYKNSQILVIYHVVQVLSSLENILAISILGRVVDWNIFGNNDTIHVK